MLIIRTKSGIKLQNILFVSRAICTRKYTMDLHLVKSIRKVLERGDVLCMYPEARYSPAGITSYIPESVGMLVKRTRFPLLQSFTEETTFNVPSGILEGSARFRFTQPLQRFLLPRKLRPCRLTKSTNV